MSVLPGEKLTSPPSAARAVIVANGSSVDAMPPAFWRACNDADVLMVGTNRVLSMAALQQVRWDVLVIRDTHRSLWHRQKWGTGYHRKLWIPSLAWKVGPADRRVTYCDEYVRQCCGWQDQRETDHNGEAAVMRNSSVALMAANFAWLCGARRLYMVGVDYCGQHARMIPPYDKADVGWGGMYDRPVPQSIERQFSNAARAVENIGGSIINLSPNTVLKALPQETWHESWDSL